MSDMLSCKCKLKLSMDHRHVHTTCDRLQPRTSIDPPAHGMLASAVCKKAASIVSTADRIGLFLCACVEVQDIQHPAMHAVFNRVIGGP